MDSGEHNADRGLDKMKYYLKRCTHQELGSVTAGGRAQRGRYLLTSMNENVLSMFPPLSKTQLNDSTLLPVVPLYSGKKVYCNYVYHNDKFHGSTAKHPRNEYRIYLNKALENNKYLFETNDIIIMRMSNIISDNQDVEQNVYYLEHIRKGESALYQRLNLIIDNSPILGGYAVFEGTIPEFEESVSRTSSPDECEVQIDDSVTNRIPLEADVLAALFNATSFRDFVMAGYNNLCAITGTVIRYESYMNLEAAHIRPRSHGGLFLPNNGIALCRDLHWAFDKGFFTFNDNLEVVVHKKTKSDYLKSFDGKKIRLPQNSFFIPDLENVKYHRDNIFGLFLTSGRL